MICRACKKQDDDLRFGICFDCALAGEKRSACRTVTQHILRGMKNLIKNSDNYKFDLKWAWERLMRTGDYKRGGIFERDYGKEIWK